MTYEPNQTFLDRTSIARACIESGRRVGMTDREIVNSTLDGTLCERLLDISERKGRQLLLGGFIPAPGRIDA